MQPEPGPKPGGDAAVGGVRLRARGDGPDGSAQQPLVRRRGAEGLQDQAQEAIAVGGEDVGREGMELAADDGLDHCLGFTKRGKTEEPEAQEHQGQAGLLAAEEIKGGHEMILLDVAVDD